MKIKSNPEFKIGDKVTMLSPYGGIVRFVVTVDSIIYKFLRKDFVYKVSWKSNSHINNFKNITYEAEGYELIKIEFEKEKDVEVDIMFEVGDKVKVKDGFFTKGVVVKIEVFRDDITMEDELMYTVTTYDGRRVILMGQFLEKYVEEYSLWEILSLLEKSDYPDGTIVNSIDKKHRFKVYNNECGIHLVDDKADTLVELKNEFIKAKYFKPVFIKSISRAEIMENFNCEEFKIVD